MPPLQQNIIVNGLSQAFKGDVLLLQSQACENPVYWLLKACDRMVRQASNLPNLGLSQYNIEHGRLVTGLLCAGKQNIF